MCSAPALACLLLLASPAAAQDQSLDDFRRCLAFTQSQGDSDAALRACNAAIDSGRAPERMLASLFHTRGIILSSGKGDFRAAISDYTRAIRVSRVPGLTAGIHVQRAVAFLGLDELENAVFDLTAGLDNRELPAPLRHLAHTERGIARMRFAKRLGTSDAVRDREWKEAERDLDRAIELLPANARALYARGVLRQTNASGAAAAWMSSDAINRLLDAAEADIAEARRLDPRVPRQLARTGIVAAPFRAPR